MNRKKDKEEAEELSSENFPPASASLKKGEEDIELAVAADSSKRDELAHSPPVPAPYRNQRAGVSKGDEHLAHSPSIPAPFRNQRDEEKEEEVQDGVQVYPGAVHVNNNLAENSTTITSAERSSVTEPPRTPDDFHLVDAKIVDEQEDDGNQVPPLAVAERLDSKNRRTWILIGAVVFVGALVAVVVLAVTRPSTPVGLVTLFGQMWDPQTTTRINLRENSLTGSIPTEIATMSLLTYLDLRDNSLTGSLPTEIGALSLLTYLDLRDNSLTGSIRTEIATMSGLTELDLGINSLTGSIPTEIGALSLLTFLSFGLNSLTGSIPTEIGTLSLLTLLSLWSNSLTGSLPTNALANLVKLNFLWLYDNQLSGSIPSSLCSLDFTNGLRIDCGKIACDCCLNRSSGDQCPAGLVTLFGQVWDPQTTRINLRDNSLTGSIPTEIATMSGLTYLDLGINSLTGSIPTEIGALSLLTFLSFGLNSLTGSIPTEIGTLSLLRFLSLWSNSLTGSIPTNALANLVKLNFLWLYDNQLSGSIPSSFCSLDFTNGLRIDCGKIACDCCLNRSSGDQCP